MNERNKTINYKDLEKQLMSQLSIDDVVKFHQSTTFHFVNHSNFHDPVRKNWLELNQMIPLVDKLGIDSQQCVSLSNKIKQDHDRFFDDESVIKLPKLANLLLRKKQSSRFSYVKNSIFQLVYIFEPSMVEGIHHSGCYLFDDESDSLYLLKKLNEKDRDLLQSHIFPINRPDDDVAIILGYAIDLFSVIIA